MPTPLRTRSSRWPGTAPGAQAAEEAIHGSAAAPELLHAEADDTHLAHAQLHFEHAVQINLMGSAQNLSNYLRSNALFPPDFVESLRGFSPYLSWTKRYPSSSEGQ